MKAYKISVYLITAIVIIGFAACSEDFVDRPPLDRLTDGSYYQTDDEVLMGTAPLYNSVWHRYLDNTILNLGDLRAGNMQTNDRQRYYRFAIPASAFEVAQAWQSLFNTVGQSNMVMYYVINRAGADVSTYAKNHAIAESRFMRGYAYYLLVVNWGHVPIIYDNLALLSDTTIARNTIESVWEFAIRDMRFAAQHLPETPIAAGRLTKWSAEGMLAKMFLTASGYNTTGGMRNQAMLDSARYYAGDVCNNGFYSLMPDYADLFLTANDNNDESMFALQWLPQTDPWGIGNSWQAFYAYDPKITGTGDGWGAAHGASIDMLEEYEPEDTLRRKATFMLFGDYYPEILSSEGGLSYRYAGIYHPDSAASYEARYTADPTKFDYAHDSINNIANLKKYIVGTPADNDGKGVILGTGVNTYMLRLAEVYLVYAESILGNDASSSDPEALKFYNMVRARAKVPEKASITFNDLLHEYRVELAIEGNFWYQLLRWYYFDKDAMFDYVANQNKGYYNLDITNISPREFTIRPVESEYYPVNDATIYLPIPEDEMAKAPNLRKTPVPFDFSQLPY